MTNFLRVNEKYLRMAGSFVDRFTRSNGLVGNGWRDFSEYVNPGSETGGDSFITARVRNNFLGWEIGKHGRLAIDREITEFNPADGYQVVFNVPANSDIVHRRS